MLGLTLRQEFKGKKMKGTAIELTETTQVPAEEFLRITYPTIDQTMQTTIQLHDIVAIKQDIKTQRFLSNQPILLRQGQVGTIVETLGNGEAFEQVRVAEYNQYG